MKTQNKTQIQNVEFFKKIIDFDKCVENCKYQNYVSRLDNVEFDITKCVIECYFKYGVEND